MKPNVMLTITSLLTILFLTFHFSDEMFTRDTIQKKGLVGSGRGLLRITSESELTKHLHWVCCMRVERNAVRKKLGRF